MANPSHLKPFENASGPVYIVYTYAPEDVGRPLAIFHLAEDRPNLLKMIKEKYSGGYYAIGYFSDWIGGRIPKLREAKRV